MKALVRRDAGWPLVSAVTLLVATAGCGEGAADAPQPGAQDTMESRAELSLVTPLVQTRNLPTELVVDGTSVYWVELPSLGSDGKSRIFKRSKSTFGIAVPQQLVAEDGGISYLMADAQYLYWINQDYVDGEIRVSAHRISKYGGAVTTVSGFTSDLHALTMDDAYFYIAYGDDIYRLSKSSGARQVIATADEGIYFNLLVDGTHVYWQNYRGIFRAPKAGGSVTQVVAAEQSPDAFVLSGSYIYYLPFASTELKRVSKTGGTATTVVRNFRPYGMWTSMSPDRPFAISGNSVYWLDSESREWGEGQVLKANLLTGFTQTITQAHGVANLAVDSSYVYWTSLGTFTNEWPPIHNNDGKVLKALR